MTMTTDEFSSLYTTVYDMCTQRSPNNFTKDLYKRYCNDMRDVSARAVALLAGKQGIRLAVALFGVFRKQIQDAPAFLPAAKDS